MPFGVGKSRFEVLLEQLARGGFNEKDYAMLVRKVYQLLDNSLLYVEPPSLKQARILTDLLLLANSIEEFYK